MDAQQLKQLVIDSLDELKAEDIKVLDVRELTTITDYMVICTGRSSRHLKSLAHAVAENAKAQGVRPYNYDFEKQTEWALVDLGDVIAHVMTSDARTYYALEKLWSETEQPPAEDQD